jgi:hypothetical protein
MHLARKCKQPNYHVMWLEREGFRDWKKFLALKYCRPSSRWTNTVGETVPLMKVPHDGIAKPCLHTLTMG